MKTISKILAIAMIMSLFASLGVLAVDHVHQDVIDSIIEEKIWTFGEFDAEKEITALQLVTMLENALGIDNAKEFIEDYSDDKIITRLDLVIFADKAGFAFVDGYENKYGVREIYTDTDDLTDEQMQSIFNVTDYGTVIALEGKKFAPEANATCLNAAEAVLALKSMTKKGYEYSVRDVTAADVPEAYDVYQTGVLHTNCGIAGFGMVARFNGGPGEIYVARTTVTPLVEDQWGNPAPPVTVARVIDPDGNVIVRVNLDYKENGKMEKVINIPEGKAGIYTIQLTNGRQGDLCEIGINNPVSWGIRGENLLGYTETTPKTGYIYIPNSYKHLSLAIGGRDTKLTLSSLDGKEKFETTYDIRCLTFGAIETADLKRDTVYKIEVADDFREAFEIIGSARLISPTAEMAADLRGGYVDVVDEYNSITVAGPLQARARAKMVEIYNKANGDFTVDATKLHETLPENVDNAIAESLLFSTYYGSVPALDFTLQGQCLDPSNEWFGMIVGYKTVSGQTAYKKDSYLSGYYDINMFGNTASAFTGALSINSELNGFYDDPALRDRVALAQLACVMTMTQDYSMMDMSTPVNQAGSWHTSFTNFKFPEWVHNYYAVRKMLDIETREICDMAIAEIADKELGMRGQGPTNQAMMNYYAVIAMYEETGDENYHTFFKRLTKALCYPNIRASYTGQAEAGYFIEGGGCDGASYEHHNEDWFHRVVMTYINLPEEKQDPETLAILIASAERNLDFLEKFQTGWVDGLDKVYATNFGARTRSGLGGVSAYTATNYMINYSSKARAIWSNNENPPIMTSGSHANTQERAYTHLLKAYPKYDKYFDATASTRNASYSVMYDEMHKQPAENVQLPYQYEGDYKIWEQPGLFAIKHKGIYMMSFYDHTLPVHTASMSVCLWQGGGPTFTWVDGLGSVTTSDKPVDFEKLPGNMMQTYDTTNYKNHWTEDEMIHAAIVGKDKNGKTFASGKERSDFEWIEEGKSFKISGTTPIDKKEITWVYNLTQEGIEITGGVDSMEGQEEYWMQIPIVDQSNKNSEYKVTYENGKAVAEYRGKKMVITWDASLESKINDHQPDAAVRTQVLKIKLPADKLGATIKMVVE